MLEQRLEGKTQAKLNCPTWTPPRIENLSSTLTGTPPFHRQHVIGIPEKHDGVQSLLDPLHLLHTASPCVLMTGRAEGLALMTGRAERG